MMPDKRYSSKIRVRSCGLLFDQAKLLLIELKSPVTNSWIWLPPGGSVELGETIEETLIREFEEETGLKVSVQKLMYFNEVIEPPIHAIEFYFLVNKVEGKMKLGIDPELEDSQQILRDIGFYSREEIKKMAVLPSYIKDQLWVDLKSIKNEKL
ncbi:MAG: NUDIX domain-containing protein [Gracilimonas sp.]